MSITLSNKNSDKLPLKTVHLLPCKIHHEGLANVQNFFITSKVQINGTEKETSAFRGRRLFSKRVLLNDGYKGIIYKETNRKSRTITAEPRENDENACFNDEDDTLACYQGISAFNEIVCWEVDEEPGVNHQVVKAAELLKIADKVKNEEF